eukprot:124027_1
MCSVFANFSYDAKKKKLVIHSTTTLDELKQRLCTRFSIKHPHCIIMLEEENILRSPINYENFDIAKQILFAADNEAALFHISTQHIDSNHDEHKELEKEDTDLSETKIVHAVQKMKLELMHKFRGGKQILPIKSKKLFNFILNNKAFLPNDQSIDKKTLDGIIHTVIGWWFDTGLKKMALDIDKEIDFDLDIDMNMNRNHDLRYTMDQTKDTALTNMMMMIKNFNKNVIKTRNYQSQLFEAAKKQNIICFMPTGSGKTRIAIKFIEYRLKLSYLEQLRETNLHQSGYKKRHIIFLVCTTHLAEQQKAAIKAAIPFIKIRKIIGANNPDTWNKNDWRIELNYYDVFVMMHDCLISALSHGYITMNNIDTLILDECHHVVGNKTNQSHPYTVVMDKYLEYKATYHGSQLPRIMGLTASPIKTKEAHSLKIYKKAEDLQRKMDCVLMRVECDELKSVVSEPMIVRYPYFSTIDLLHVDLLDIPKVFMDKLPKYAKLINRLGSVITECGIYGACVAMRLFDNKLRQRDVKYLVCGPYVAQHVDALDDKFKDKKQAIALFKKYISQNLSYFDHELIAPYADNKGDDATWRFDCDISMKLSVLIKFINDSHSCIKGEIMGDHCKDGDNEQLNGLFFNNHDVVKQQGIIFVKERLVAYVLQSILSTRFKHIKFGVLTGHSCRLWGMNDKQQLHTINEFKSGDINYLIATSVAEEGIDIQACNCVIMYTLPPTVKTYIQSRGRARKKASKFVLFIDTTNEEQNQRVQRFAKHEQEMIDNAQHNIHNKQRITNSNTTSNSRSKYELKVEQTQAFASTVNAVSMLQRYIDYLGITKNEIEKYYVEIETGHECVMKFATSKWKLSTCLFRNRAGNKKDAERKCAVDIVSALREQGLWDLNLVPVEILRRNKETQLLQRERALFQSVKIRQLNMPSLFRLQTHSQSSYYLYHIHIDHDPNHFAMGLVLPKEIPDGLLKYIQFAIQIRKRNVDKVQKDLNEYAKLIHDKLNSGHQDADGNAQDNEDDDAIRSVYIQTQVSLNKTGHSNGNLISLSAHQLSQMKQYHQFVFKLLDRGGSKKKRQLVELTPEEQENDRFYLICPLKAKDYYGEYDVDWQCIDRIVSLQSFYRKGEPTGIEYVSNGESKLQYELFQTQNRDAACTKQNIYISYGVSDLFGCESTIPVPGQIIADWVDDDTRVEKILSSNIDIVNEEKEEKQMAWTDNEEEEEEEGENEVTLGDEIDLNAQHTQLNQLATITIEENCAELVRLKRNTKYDKAVIMARRYCPKIRNILYINNKNGILKAKKRNEKKKCKLKSSVMFIPLQNVFPTGISSSHWYQLLNMAPIVWRVENYLNIFDAYKLLHRMTSEYRVDYDLLLESLCNVQAGFEHKSYESLECLGDKVLKFLVVLHGIFSAADKNQGELTMWESALVSNANLDKLSIGMGLPCYGAFNQFSFELWNPSLFRHRDITETLYDNINISLKLPADIIESTLGAVWCSNKSSISCRMNASRLLLREYNLLPQPFCVDVKFAELIGEWNENKFEHIYTRRIFQSKMAELTKRVPLDLQNPIVTASLIELIDKCYYYHHHSDFSEYGISFQRLEFLGDAILDIIVTQFLYDDLCASNMKGTTIEGAMTTLRAKIVGNDALGFNFQDSSLDEIILWDQQQKIDVAKYKNDIDRAEENEDEFNDWWYLKDSNIKPPKCLGDSFEVLLAIIFIDSNADSLFDKDSKHNHYNLMQSVNFICAFHDYAEKYWKHKRI